jgi:Protein of unknown function (DUF2778)
MSTVACYDFGANNNRRSARKTRSRHFFGSAAVASLVLGCAWTVYANIFAASVYPSLSSTSFDTPVIKRRPTVAAVRVVPLTANKVADAFADLASNSAPAVSAPANVASATTLTFEDRFAAAAPQGVAPQPVEAAQSQRQVASLPPANHPAAETAPDRQVAALVPTPAQRPAEAPAKTGASVHDMAHRAKAIVMAAAAPPEKQPTLFERLFGKLQSSGASLAYASADADSTSSLGPASQNIAQSGTVPLYDRQTAVYDISAHMVYLPNGTKLEAHSGLGSELDDPRSAKIRMRGVTPPHLYDLKPREALFHGVAALRLNPVGGDEAIYGRAGLLAHTYMLGPNGDSNGCVSFKDYEAFLRAYRNGEVKRLAVVAKLD